MKKPDFIKELVEALEENNMSQQLINENVNYYSSYIDEEIRSGNTENEVLERLGSARMIARTIVDANASRGREYSSNYSYGEYKSTSSDENSSYRKHFFKKRKKDINTDDRFGNKMFNVVFMGEKLSFKDKLKIALIVLLVLTMVVFSIILITKAIIFIIPFVLVFAILYWLVKLIFRY